MTVYVIRPLTPREQAEIVVQEAVEDACSHLIGVPLDPMWKARVLAAVDVQLKTLLAQMRLPPGVEVTEIEEAHGDVRVRVIYPDPCPPF